MFFISILLLTILIPSIQSAKPTIKLTFSPDEKYYTMGNQVEIHCEILNPTENTETPQLWHVDFKTGRHTPISRSLLYSAPDDALDLFKQNQKKRLEYVKKNYIRIRQLLVEDSAKYECNCPDCEESLGKQEKILQVMKLVAPRWHIEPNWPIQEDGKTTIKCVVDDFYPYVSHKIIHNHHDITHEGKNVVIPNNNVFPQKFSWEAVVTPKADWHNTTLRCTVTEGSSEQHEVKHLEISFTPRFDTCGEKQHVDSTKDKATIECSYSGNPAPKLTWYRQIDDKPIASEPGIHVEVKDEHHGKYKSIVTFDREKLVALQLLTTTTKAPNGQPDTAAAPKISGDTFYQQLLNGGFVAKLTYNNEEKGSRKVSIVGDANEARINALDSSTTKPIQNLSASMIFFSFLIILYMIQHH